MTVRVASLSQGPAHNIIKLIFLGCGVVHVIQHNISRPAAAFLKVIDALLENFPHILHGGHILCPGSHGQLMLDIVAPLGMFYAQDIIKAHGGQHLQAAVHILRKFFMPAQILGGVIGGAKHLHPSLGQHSPHGKARPLELLIAVVPDFLGSLGCQQSIFPKESLKFQVGPVIDRVACRPGQDLGKFKESFIGGRIFPRDVLFLNTSGAHKAPLVRIVIQPCFGEIVILPVLCYFFG